MPGSDGRPATKLLVGSAVGITTIAAGLGGRPHRLFVVGLDSDMWHMSYG